MMLLPGGRVEDFPVDQLSATAARIWTWGDDISMEIDLAPIDVFQGSAFSDRLIRLDRVRLPSTDLAALSGRTFDFPVNPEDGYIDGSVYFLDRHNPVDVSRIVFSGFAGDSAIVTIEAAFLLEFEATGYRNFQKVLSCRIRQEAPR